MWLWFEGQGKEMRRIFALPQPPSGIAKNAAGNEGWEEVGASCKVQGTRSAGFSNKLDRIEKELQIGCKHINKKSSN